MRKIEWERSLVGTLQVVAGAGLGLVGRFYRCGCRFPYEDLDLEILDFFLSIIV